MTTDQFWTIVEQARDPDSEANGERLFERLCILPEQEVIAFDRLWTGYAVQLYTNLLWGVAFLARGGCSKERFADWRNWIVAQGREVYEIARGNPDGLVLVIDANPEAGRGEIRDVIGRALRARNSRWEDGLPEHKDIHQPSEPSGPEWGTEEDLKPLLPKMWARYAGESSTPEAGAVTAPDKAEPAVVQEPVERTVEAAIVEPEPVSTNLPPQDPPPVERAPAASVPDEPAPASPPPSPSRATPASTREPKEIPVTQSPVKKPWWKVW